MKVPAPAKPIAWFVLFALLFHRFWSQTIIFRDSFTLHAPLKYLVAKALSAGEVWAWNPWQYLGMPFVADALAGWFYPLNAIYLILPFERAHCLFILIHYPLAAIGMDMFLRGRGIGRAAALFGAMVFSLSGYMISQHSNVSFLIGPAWAPLALYLMDRAFSGGARWAAGAGAAVCMQVFGGDPQSAAITCGLIALMTIGRAASSPRKVSIVLSALLALAAALVLSAVQILPAWELMGESVRAGGVRLADAVYWSFNPARAVEFIWPAPFGAVWPEHNYWGQEFLGGRVDLPWSLTNYIGLPALALAVVGVALGKRRWRMWIGIGAVFFLLLSMGDFTPVYGIFHRLPIAGLFRFPAKYLAWFSLMVAMASALGMEEIGARLAREGNSLFKAALAYMAATIALGLVSIPVWRMVIEGADVFKVYAGLSEIAASHLWRGWAQVMIANLAAGAVLAAAAKRWMSVRMWAAVFIAVILADLYFANLRPMPSGAREMLDPAPSEVCRAIEADGGAGLGGYRFYRSGGVRFTGGDKSSGLTRLERRAMFYRDSIEPNLAAMCGLENLTGYNAAAPRLGYPLLEGRRDPKLWARFNVAYAIAPYGQAPRFESLGRVVHGDSANNLAVVRLEDPMPRAYWVPSAVAVPDERTAMAALDSVDHRSHAVITTDERIQTTPPGGRSMKPATIVSYEPDNVDLEIETDSAGWLVLLDRHYPGWTATVNHEQVKIYKANVMARALRLPPGKHSISFQYRPPLLRIGAAISAPAWIALIAWWTVIAVKKKKPRMNAD